MCAAGMSDEEEEDGMVMEMRGGVGYFWERPMPEDEGVEPGRREEEGPRYANPPP